MGGANALIDAQESVAGMRQVIAQFILAQSGSFSNTTALPCPGDKTMKIGIQTWGSNGDIRPLLALAQGLQKSRTQCHAGCQQHRQ